MNTVSEIFHELAAGGIRPLDWEVGISWTKQRNTDINWFTLNQSTLNGNDLLGSSDSNAMQPWDAYDYIDTRDRIIELTISRSVEFPYNIQSAICDVKLNNYDGYFSLFNPSSPIANYILPARPIRAYLGFKGAGLTPAFVGTTQAPPTYSEDNNTVASLTAMDFLAQISDMSLRNMVMLRDVRTDEAIAAILDQFGLEPYMYKLSQGKNIIPFVYFDSDKNAGNALRELVQAENGTMWIDEQGIINFEPRTAQIGKDSVMIFDKSSIVSIAPSQTDNIVNRIYVEADVRKVMEFQQFFTMDNANGYSSSADDDQYRLRANSTTSIWLNFEDPVWSATVNPVLNGSSDNSSFTVVNLNGDKVNSGVTAQGTLFATSMKIDFTNANNFPVSIDYLQIWGEPAKIVGSSPTIKYTAEDSESIEKFGVKELIITDNTCFGNQVNIDSFAEDVLKSYSGYSPTLELEVKGDPSLQIQDIVTINGTEYDGEWLIKAISHHLSESRLTTKISVVRTEVTKPFILNRSVLNGTDVLS